ncbi:MAG: glycoside hydrolase family 127 protein [Verrucomicrobia bacterium]|nr:glycoside hydrolase family 127 protein [Verrucomicrobiota bacterium]
MKHIALFLGALVILSGRLSGSELFQFMKVGEVQPRGWLLEQIRTDATCGYGPVLDKLTDRCEVPVFDSRNKSELAKPKIGEVWWNGETTGNWLDGLIRTAYLSGDAATKRQVDGIVTRILAMQEEDGYLGTYPKALRYEQPVTTKNGELWSQTCLFRGLLAYHEFTGRRDVLEAVRRAAKLMISKYGPDRPYWKEGAVGAGGGPGHNIMFVDVCEWLYRLTGDKSFVEFSKFLYDGYSELVEIRERDIQLRHLANMDELFEGHGAHVMEHLRVPLFVHHATRDAKYRAAADNCSPKTARHLSAGGACISDEGVHQRAGSASIGCEYCTMLELLHSLQSGVEKTGRAPLGDWIEVLAFNSAQGARQRDGKAIQYCTRDNQYEATRKGAGSRFKLSPTHDDVAVCCPVTALKFFPYFVNQLWMKSADGLVAVSYAPNELTTTVNGVKVRITTETAYPFEDEVRMTVTPEKPVKFALRLRIPDWVGETKVRAAGSSATDENGWRVLTKEWKPGDRVTISFTPEVERKTMSNGEVYWKRGPLVFALPIPSERKSSRSYAVEGFADYEYTPKAGAFWDYAVDKGNDAFQFERVAAKGDPWAKPPLRLTGNLLNRKTNVNEPVALVPMGTSLLRRTTFSDMKLLRALQGDANLARKARVEVPSTAPRYDARALIDGVAEGYPDNLTAEWASKGGGVGTKVKLSWAEPVKVGSVWLFDRPNPADHVCAARLSFSDGSTAQVGEFPNDGATPFKLSFPEKAISWMEVVITKVGPRNKNAGFAEIAVFAPVKTGADASPRPNVLFIAVDDLNPMLGCYGRATVKSPNMDRLAADGLLFRRAYCQTALCMPSRSSLLSGYRPETLRNKAKPLTGNAPAGTISLPQLFRAHGYTTVSIGKVFHYNNDDPGGWVRRHTDTFASEGQWCDGYCSGYQLPANQALVQNYLQGRRLRAGLAASPIAEITDTPDEKTPDGIIARRAVEELRALKQAGAPFFLAAGFYRPHMPLTAPKKYWDLYDRRAFKLPANFHQPDDGIRRDDWGEVRRYGDCPLSGPMPEDKAREIIHGYHASITFVDAQIGKVLDELRRLDLDRNTIVVLWSDNGWHLGDHGRWSKPTNFESATRITLMISVPGMSRNQKTDALVELIDIYPSLCELCRVPPPGYLEGTSFAPLLRSPNRPWKTAAFSCLIDYTTVSIRTDRYRFIRRASGQDELYDHHTDPAEDKNLAQDPAHQDAVRALRAALEAGWKKAALSQR